MLKIMFTLRKEVTTKWGKSTKRIFILYKLFSENKIKLIQMGKCAGEHYILTVSLVVPIPTDRFNTNNCVFSRTVYLLAACGSYNKRRLTCNYL